MAFRARPGACDTQPAGKRRAVQRDFRKNGNEGGRSSSVTVYDGQRLLGTIVEKRGRFAATHAAGTYVGTFPTQGEAMASLSGGGRP